MYWSQNIAGTDCWKLLFFNFLSHSTDIIKLLKRNDCFEYISRYNPMHKGFQIKSSMISQGKITQSFWNDIKHKSTHSFIK